MSQYLVSGFFPHRYTRFKGCPYIHSQPNNWSNLAIERCSGAKCYHFPMDYMSGRSILKARFINEL